MPVIAQAASFDPPIAAAMTAKQTENDRATSTVKCPIFQHFRKLDLAPAYSASLVLIGLCFFDRVQVLADATLNQLDLEAVIDIDQIMPDPDQPRKEFDQEALERLAHSQSMQPVALGFDAYP